MAYPLEYMSPKIPGLGDVDWGKYVLIFGDVTTGASQDIKQASAIARAMVTHVSYTHLVPLFCSARTGLDGARGLFLLDLRSCHDLSSAVL